jgi:hypothetical protein
MTGRKALIYKDIACGENVKFENRKHRKNKNLDY